MKFKIEYLILFYLFLFSYYSLFLFKLAFTKISLSYLKQFYQSYKKIVEVYRYSISIGIFIFIFTTLICFLRYGLSNSLFFSSILAFLLIVIAIIDIHTLLIFDCFHYLLLFLSVIHFNMSNNTLPEVIIGSCIISLPLFLLSILSRQIGLGDVKLIAAAGTLLGISKIMLAFFIAVLTGSICSIYFIAIKKESHKKVIPFAPALCCGIFIAFLTIH